MAQYMKLFKIRFTHSTIYDRFGNGPHKGKLLDDALDDLMDGSLDVEDFPPIAVICAYGKFWSMDNRRLLLFKKLHCRIKNRVPRGLIPVTVMGADDIPEEEWEDKFTTRNGGTYVDIVEPWEEMACEACGRMCKNSRNLRRHWRNSEHQVYCSRCGAKFLLECEFEDHKQFCSRKANAEVVEEYDDTDFDDFADMFGRLRLY